MAFPLQCVLWVDGISLLLLLSDIFLKLCLHFFLARWVFAISLVLVIISLSSNTRRCEKEYHQHWRALEGLMLDCCKEISFWWCFHTTTVQIYIEFQKLIHILKKIVKHFCLCTLCLPCLSQFHWSNVQRQNLRKCGLHYFLPLSVHTVTYKMHINTLLSRRGNLICMACQINDCLSTNVLLRVWNQICSIWLSKLLFKAGSSS